MNDSDPEAGPPIRCAIYTRTSVDPGFANEFSSVTHQRDICSAYIMSQQHRDWLTIASRYDDAGISGRSLERPGLRQLLTDIQHGLVDMVLVYKLDRLSRSLSDFMRLVAIFETSGVVFVSVTEAFDATGSLGRLILNVLLTFAQFEVEMSVERKRIRISSVVSKGKLLCGPRPLGYDLVGGHLVINEPEAAIVREIFERYIELRTYRAVAIELAGKGRRSKAWVCASGVARGGSAITGSSVYAILQRRLYVGEICYKGEIYPAQHEPIVSRALWDAAERVRAERGHSNGRGRRSCLLTGLAYDNFGRKLLGHVYTKEGREYRYYISARTRASRPCRLQTLWIDAAAFEAVVLERVCDFLRDVADLGGAVRLFGPDGKSSEALAELGSAEALRLERLEPSRLRVVFENAIVRIELSSTKGRIILSCDAILALLRRDLSGSSHARDARAATAFRIHVLDFDVRTTLRPRPPVIPVNPRETGGRPDRRLIRLLAKARAIREAIHQDRHLSLEEIAPRFERSASRLARMLRLNYLAPDIQTAILDGHHPSGLTSRRLLYGNIPMDWHEQRKVLGFPPRSERQRRLGTGSRRDPAGAWKRGA